jgi:hypothetical protein
MHPPHLRAQGRGWSWAGAVARTPCVCMQGHVGMGVVAGCHMRPPHVCKQEGCQGGESGVDHLTVLATPPVFRAPAIWGAISSLRVR